MHASRLFRTIERCVWCLALVALNGLISPGVLAGPADVSDGLYTWLRADQGIAPVGGRVHRWQDQSGNGNDATWTAGAPFGEQAPVYQSATPSLSDQPSLRFDGQNALEIVLDDLVGSDYTVFVVNGRTNEDVSANFYLAGTGIEQNTNLILGYERPNLLRLSHWNNDLDAPVSSPSGPVTWSLDVFQLKQSEGRRVRQNAETVATDTQTNALISLDGMTLGHFRVFQGQFFFHGHLAEVVIYDRALDPEEIALVEADLATRYPLPIELPPTDPPGGVSDGLATWFRADRGISAGDGQPVPLWVGYGNLAELGANPFGELPPIYDRRNPAVRGQPTVRFEGENALMPLRTFSLGRFYTIFVVNGRDRGGADNFYFAGTNHALGYAATDRLHQSLGPINVSLEGVIEPYGGAPDWSIDVFRNSATDVGVGFFGVEQYYAQEFYRNGDLVTTGYQDAPMLFGGNAGNNTIGHRRDFSQSGNDAWYVGDIAEIIVYDRGLSFEEQAAVEAYLSERYGIPLVSRLVESAWVEESVAIDGAADESIWTTAGVFELDEGPRRLGSVRVANDAENLYLLIDLVANTVEDHSGGFSMDVDANENGIIDDGGGDLWYEPFRGPFKPLELCFIEGVGRCFLNCVSGCPTIRSNAAAEFGPSPWAPQPHWIREWALNLDEMSAREGETIRVGFLADSGDPAYFFRYPQFYWSSFERMIEIRLGSGPPLFLDGFEEP
jgi:hypothetical protein